MTTTPTVGIPGGQRVAGMSAIGFGNSGIDGIGTNAIRHKTDNKTFQVSEKLALSRGRHYLSMGGQLLHYTMGQDYASNSGLLGSFAFNGGYTGFGFADFLLDQVGSKSIGESEPLDAAPEPPRPLLPGRLQGQLQADLEPGPALGVRVSRSRRRTTSRSTSTSTPARASSPAGTSATASTRPTTAASRPGSASPGRRTRRRSSAAATGWSSTRRAPAPTAACP